ncbi:flagellar assembly protein FliW [Paenibacillus algicola]|uniref:flagellar assembly protein FliW n=1 Tax=Paenibacillus algicola TaxID=2565926 RepID=UPI001E598D13|nr:flagellar assembly protein FliW [Paenibacillus algicola]
MNTAVFGEIEMPEEQIYHFPKGIPGFENEHQFALLFEENSPFMYMQSLQNKDLSFVVTDPFSFYPDYEFDLPDNEAEELHIDDDLFIKCILTVRDSVKDSTVNLLAPLVFNPKNRLAKQIVLRQVPYQTKHLLWQHPQGLNEKEGV